jgi:Right handed beta helix region
MPTRTCRVLWLGAALASVSAGCGSSARPDGATILRPGQDLQPIVARAPEGTRFVFEPGVYRAQTIYPKDRQSFVGQAGVVLSGAIELTEWTHVSGLWRADGLPAPLDYHGECEHGRELCNRREDLFVDGRLYERRPSRHGLAAGQWSYQAGRAWLADDPSGRLVELGVTPVAFAGDAEDVIVEDLVVEKYASDAQYGALHLDGARGWLIAGVTARWNHGVGLFFGAHTRITGGSFSHNGQLGIAVTGGEGSRIEGVEIAYNNYAGYDAAWEAGGTKFWATTGLIVRNSCVHHNAGPGLWTDFDNIHTVYEGNTVFLNGQDGIKHEISYDAIIRNNLVAANGQSKDEWLWGSQILIQDSSNVEAYGNLVEISSDFGNGIGVIYQGRGEGAYGPWRADSNRIHDNTIIHLGSRGQNGVVTDTGDPSFWQQADNRFNPNSYVVADRAAEYWTAHDRNVAWDHVQELGFETSGALIVEQRPPLQLSCDR